MTLCVDHDEDGCPIAYILKNMRAEDRAELRETNWPLEAIARTLHVEPVIGCIFRDHSRLPAVICCFQALTPRALQVSLLATDRWDEVARKVIRWGVREAKPTLIRAGFTRAECRMMEGHRDATRLLEHLGFVLEARLARYGATGRAFLQYAWRAEDHVFNGTAIAEQLLPQCAGHRPSQNQAL